MKLRTSFFNQAVFRKDIGRFAPAWGIYLIGGLLVVLTAMSDSNPCDAACFLVGTIGPFAAINCLFALLNAQLLFGDLFNSRLCNALHALPLRREAWFGTHVVSGLLFSLVPHAIGVLFMMPMLMGYEQVALLWLLGMALEYLFFFGVAVFSTFLTGNRFAMAAVYGIINFLSLILAWFIDTMYRPLLWGVCLNTERFQAFSPVANLANMKDFVIFKWPEVAGPVDMCEVDGLDQGKWIYLAVLAALGLVLLGISLLLYRRRALESAGDFLAEKKLNPVFSVIFTLTVGAVVQVFGNLFSGDGSYLYLAVGIVVGYFASQMLLERTVRVFQPKRFLRLAILVAALGISLVVTALDPIGISRYVPDAGEVELLQLDDMTLTDPEDLEKAAAIHKQILKTGEDDEGRRRMAVTFRYTRKDGSVVEREYVIDAASPAGQMLKMQFFSRPEYVMGYSDWETYRNSVNRIMVMGQPLEIEDKEYLQQLLEAVKADCEAGVMAQSWAYQEEWSYKPYELEIGSDRGNYGWCYLRIPAEATHTVQWLEAHSELWDGVTPS